MSPNQNHMEFILVVGLERPDVDHIFFENTWTRRRDEMLKTRSGA